MRVLDFRSISAFVRAAGGGRVLLVALGVLFALMASVSPASAVCYSSGKPCGINAAFNDRLCCPGTLCGWGGVCQSGCRINGQFYRPGALNPQNPCQKCDPSASMTRWTEIPVCAFPVRFLWEDISATGTPIVLGDDEVSGAVPLGFTFRYFGTDYTDIYVSSNGFLTVLPGQESGCCSGAADPERRRSRRRHRRMVGGPLPARRRLDHVRDPRIGHRIGSSSSSSTPSSTSAAARRHGSSSSSSRGRTAIEVHYRNPASDGGTHSAGIENQSGTTGVQHYFGAAPLPAMTAVGYRTP